MYLDSHNLFCSRFNCEFEFPLHLDFYAKKMLGKSRPMNYLFVNFLKSLLIQKVQTDKKKLKCLHEARFKLTTLSSISKYLFTYQYLKFIWLAVGSVINRRKYLRLCVLHYKNKLISLSRSQQL